MQESAAAAPEAEDINTLVANADIARGQTLYLQCRACHTLNAGGANKVGPNLHGMFDRKAGLAPGFAYSDALKNSDLTWDLASLDPWLARPSAFLPGNRMVFVGVKKPQDRANLIAFLQRETVTAE
jgi:cytochrome c